MNTCEAKEKVDEEQSFQEKDQPGHAAAEVEVAGRHRALGT